MDNRIGAMVVNIVAITLAASVAIASVVQITVVALKFGQKYNS